MKLLNPKSSLTYLSVAIAAASFATPALADISINSNSPYSRVISEGKTDSLSRTEGQNASFKAAVADLLKNWESYTPADRARILSQPSLGVLNDGDTFTLYDDPASQIGATVASKPIERIGAGSTVPTKTVGGSTVLDIADSKQYTFGGTTYNFAGGEAKGAVSIGNETDQRRLVNVSAATLSATSTEAVNGSQLYAAGQAINTNAQNITTLKNKVDQGINVKADAGTMQNLQLGDTFSITGTPNNIKTTVSTLPNGDKNVNVGLTDDVTVNKTLTTGGKITAGGGVDANSNKITNVADGDINATSKDAINGSQLFKQINDVKALIPTNGTVNTYWTISDGVNTDQMNTTETITYQGGDSNVKVTVSDNKVTTQLADDININKTITAGGKITGNGGLDSGGNKVTNVADGDISATSKDAINGSQLHTTNTNLTNLTNKVNQGWTLQDSTGATTNVQMGSTLKTLNTDGNVKVTVQNGAQVVNLADRITVKEVRTPNVTIGDHIDAGGTRITNVSEGIDGTDAVNVNQLNNAISSITNVGNLNKRFEEIDDNAKAGTAAAIAVASLGQAWDYGSNSISVAGSTYDGKGGWAVGGSHITDNGRWMVKYNVSGSDNKRYGFGASATYQY